MSAHAWEPVCGDFRPVSMSDDTPRAEPTIAPPSEPQPTCIGIDLVCRECGWRTESIREHLTDDGHCLITAYRALAAALRAAHERAEEYKREWESAIEREQAAQHLRAEAHDRAEKAEAFVARLCDTPAADVQAMLARRGQTGEAEP